MMDQTQTAQACLAQEGVSCALAALSAIEGSGFFAVPPHDQNDRLRHEHGTWLLAMLADQLNRVQEQIDALDASKSKLEG